MTYLYAVFLLFVLSIQMESYYLWRPLLCLMCPLHRCLFVSACSIYDLSEETPTPHTYPNRVTTLQVWAMLHQHVVLPHVCFLWQMEIKWALMHTGAAVCLCFAPLEISMHALCDLQRDDKLKGRIQSRAENRNTHTENSGCHSSDKDMGAEENLIVEALLYEWCVMIFSQSYTGTGREVRGMSNDGYGCHH